MTAVALTNDASSLWGTSNEVSDVLRAVFRETQQELSQADTWNRLGDAMAELEEVYRECSVNDWDGYGGLAVTAGAYQEAKVLLNALPRTLPIPEIAAEPDGSIALEWDRGANQIFALSVNGKGVIVYAGLLGRGIKAHGTEVFNDSLPQTIILHIKRICR